MSKLTPPQHRRALGDTGLFATALSCGSGNWTAFRTGEGDKTVGESIELIHALFESDSVRFLDTSNNYGLGESERRIGLAIREYGGLPQDFVLQTKADRDMTTGDFSGERMRRSLDESRERLGLDTLPLVYLHDPENTSWDESMADDGPVAALVEARDAGVIGHLGISGGPEAMLRRYVETGLFEALITHNRFTLVDRTADALLSLASDHGIGVLNASPYGGGLLTRWPVEPGWYAYDQAAPALVTAANQIGEICAAAGIPIAAAALWWSLRDPRITSTIIGMRTIADLRATDELLGVEIPAEVWAAIETVRLDASTWQDAR
ncbi:MAG: aldo/keto reductase [Microbacteriaceae bacterium]|nr:aldo/keto reductase [Microbacteriaceae bacterium]